MNYKYLRVRITEDLMKDYKKICVDLDLSLPKQTTQIIKSFVEIQKENKRRLNKD